MLDAGVHFGHRVRRWNPAMAPYIYGQKYGIHIIDIVKSLQCLRAAYTYIQHTKEKNILFVGTKRAASALIEIAAHECGEKAYFVNHRWLGGFLTNWSTMRGCIYRLNTLTPENASSKKERLELTKQKARLEKFFRGVKDMRSKPDLLVIIGQQEEVNAVKEAQVLKIPNITLVDTDCNPRLATYCIPGNDDSVRSIQLILSKLVHARTS